MLYVFQMDVGQMLTFDMSLLMDTVSKLQQEIARATGIAVDKQILLVSGGHSLKPDQKVMTYGAGADTNPVFLFSKLAIESQEPPLVRSFGVPKDLLTTLREKISEAIKLPPAFDTVAIRTKLACQIRDSANKMHIFCNNEFKEQHLQNQGWGTVVANLEEIAQAMQKTSVKFTKAFHTFLPNRVKHFSMLENFNDTVELLDRIPLVRALKDKEEAEPVLSKQSMDPSIISFVASSVSGPSTLLEWITTQGQGQRIEVLQHKCYEDLLMLNEEMFEVCDQQVQELLKRVSEDPHQMKELVGIGRRLSELEKRLNETKKIAKEQSDMAQGFLNHQSSLSTTKDAATILPDLCKSHRHQLQQMLERQQRLEALQNSFRKSKQEMSTNIHQRLGWVMHVETEISKVDSELIFHMKTLRVLECNLELLSQVKAAPQVYADMVMEAARRRIFASKFLQWAEGLADDSGQLYKSEVERRKQFARKLGEHFLLNTLFKGFEDMPPSFANKSPPPFDVGLPEITMNDIAYLKSTVPELEEFFCLSLEGGSFPHSLLSKLVESPHLQMITPHSQSSQTEWSSEATPHPQPSVIVATEAPPTKFALPDLQESVTTEYLPAVSSLTETMRDVMSPGVKPSDSKHTTSDSSISAAQSDVPGEPTAAMHSVKTQTKTNSTNTDSTSPVSSNEFATADFYFEDSIPSPMADSPSDKKDKKMDTSKSDSELVASLQVELAEKISLIKDLELKLKENTSKMASHRDRDGSSDESTTMISKSGASDTVVASDSGETVSSDSSSPNLASVTKKEETAKGGDSSEQQSQQAGPAASEESIRIRKLEWELQLANTDLNKFKESLFETSTNFEKNQAKHQSVLQEKNNQLQELKTEVKKVQEELVQTKDSIKSKDENISLLEKDLIASKSKIESLEKEVNDGNGSMERIRLRFLELRDKLKIHIPEFRQTLADLRNAVTENKSDMDSAVTSAMTVAEKQVSSFHSSVLSDVVAEYSKKEEDLKTEIQQLKQKLFQSEAEFSEKQTHLNSRNEVLSSEMEKQKEEYAQKLKKNQEDFDRNLKDLKTQHDLEMELELDKCKAELRESMEENERAMEGLTRLKDDLRKELEAMKKSSVMARDSLVRAHKEKMETLERSLVQDKELELSQLMQRLESEMEAKLGERNNHIAELEAKLTEVQTNLVAEQEQALTALREKLSSESQVKVDEMRQQLEDQKQSMAELLEQKQLGHVQKLTELKTDFDMERESLIAQVKKLQPREKQDSEAQTRAPALSDMNTQTTEERNNAEVQTEREAKCDVEIQTESDKMSDSEVQTDYDLLAESLIHSKTQTEILDFMADAMTSSETQTGLELLADVISLTSSASYGSEEMLGNKQGTAATDEREGKDTGDSVTKLQQTVDDLATQLANAQDKIIMLEKEVSTLNEEKKEWDSFRAGGPAPGSPSPKGEQTCYQDMMQSSNTGASFMVMDKEPASSPDTHPVDPEAIRARDRKIAQLEKKMMEMSMTAQEREVASDKVSIRGCEKGDLVLLCLDERHDQYVVFTVGTNLHFLHSDSLVCLGLKPGTQSSCRKSWILAEVVDKEYCLAKKPNNRFRVPQGTCFYRVKCKPWKSEVDLSQQEREFAKQIKPTKTDYGIGARPKKL